MLAKICSMERMIEKTNSKNLDASITTQASKNTAIHELMEE